MNDETYWLKSDWQDEWTEVTKEQWIKAERQAGFRPKCASTELAYMTTCATGGFTGGGISGKIVFDRRSHRARAS